MYLMVRLLFSIFREYGVHLRLPFVPDPFRSPVLIPVRLLSMCQIDLLKNDS